jgi:hypothetical protein
MDVVRMVDGVNLSAQIYRDTLVDVEAGKPDAERMARFDREALVERLRSTADLIEAGQVPHRCDEGCRTAKV